MKKQDSAISLFKHPGLGVLILLAFINLFNYLDRYILVALSPAIKRDLNLSDTEVGVLASAFIFSYFLISPVFGWLGDRKPRLHLMSIGVALWSLATAGSSLAKSFISLLLARFGVGVGEAAYGAISPSVLTDLYPKALRGRVFSVFFMAIPVGSALGFLLGGLLEKLVGWRHAFWIVGLPGLVLAAGLLLTKEPKRGAQEEDSSEAAIAHSLKETISALFQNRSFVLSTLGYCAYTFVVGGIAVWIPHYIERYLGVPASEGNMAFGAITVTAGFLGTFVGGAWGDRWAKRSPDAYLKLSAISMFAAFPIYALVLTVSGFWGFVITAFVLEFLLFLSTSPVNAQIVNCVSPTMRATANATSIFMIHLLGDAISPTLVGAISDRSTLLMGMWVFAAVILVSGVIWAIKPLLFWEAMPWPEGAVELPKVQVHRGLERGGVQENTLAAFRAAKSAGGTMIELDVHMSRDGIPVVVHDKNITRISGKTGIVKEMTAKELADAAQVPTLEEVLIDAETKGLKVNIELKSNSAFGDGVESAVASLLKAHKAENRVMFSSFNPLVLRRLSKVLPNVPRALLATAERDPENKFYLRWMILGTFARPHMLNYDGRFLTAKFAKQLDNRHVPFSVWTVSEPAEAKKFLEMGAKSIISPLPEIL